MNPPPPKADPLKDPPRAVLQAEKAALGCMLIDAKGVEAVCHIIDTNDFHATQHRLIYHAAATIYGQAGQTDPVSVCEELRKRKKLDEAGGVKYVIGLTEEVASTEHAAHYAKIVREASLDRQVINCLHGVAKAKTPENVKLLADLVFRLNGVYQKPALDFTKDLPAVLDKFLAQVEPTMSTGLPGLDAVLGGIDAGDLITVGARTSVGKTAFMTKLCLNMAAAGVPCLYVTTEMTDLQMVLRVLPMASKIPAWKFRKRILDADDLKAVRSVISNRLSKLPVHVYGKSQISGADLRSAVQQTKPRVLIVDYLQRCEMPKGDLRAYQVAEFMTALKTFTQDAGLITVLGCQLDRKLDKAATAPPTLSDLKDSGAIESESDQVILLWKPPKKQAGLNTHTSIIEAVIAKNRHGSAGLSVDLELDGSLVEIIDRAEAAQDKQTDMWKNRSDLK